MNAVYWHPQAQLEFEEAIDFYESQTTGLGKEFSEAIATTIDTLRSYPLLAAVDTGQTRKAVAHRFPYHIFYRTDEKIFLSYRYCISDEIRKFGKSVLIEPLASCAESRLKF